MVTSSSSSLKQTGIFPSQSSRLTPSSPMFWHLRLIQPPQCPPYTPRGPLIHNMLQDAPAQQRRAGYALTHAPMDKRTRCVMIVILAYAHAQVIRCCRTEQNLSRAVSHAYQICSAERRGRRQVNMALASRLALVTGREKQFYQLLYLKHLPILHIHDHYTL